MTFLTLRNEEAINPAQSHPFLLVRPSELRPEQRKINEFVIIDNIEKPLHAIGTNTASFFLKTKPHHIKIPSETLGHNPMMVDERKENQKALSDSSFNP